jgi:hypothetical protein
LIIARKNETLPLYSKQQEVLLLSFEPKLEKEQGPVPRVKNGPIGATPKLHSAAVA